MIPHRLDDGRKLLATQIVISIPVAADYIVKIGAKVRKEQGQNSRSKPVVQELVKMGALKPGDTVTLLRPPISTEHPNVQLPNEEKSAVFVGGNRFTWSDNNETMT